MIASKPLPVVLDASAVLALLFNEAGAALVMQHLQSSQCIVGAGNQAEIISRLLDKGLSPNDIRAALGELNIHWQGNTCADGQAAGFMRAITRTAGLSLGDRLCLALAQRLNASVLTSDRAWLELATYLQVTIISIRPAPTVH